MLEELSEFRGPVIGGMGRCQQQREEDRTLIEDDRSFDRSSQENSVAGERPTQSLGILIWLKTLAKSPNLIDERTSHKASGFVARGAHPLGQSHDARLPSMKVKRDLMVTFLGNLVKLMVKLGRVQEELET